jgi:hypothetical protein
MGINRENIDKYYDEVNDKLGKYFKMNISPSKLMKYFKKDGYGIKKFKDREGYSDVDGIDKIITDCVEDRVAMEESGIMTFESYNKSYFINLNFSIDEMYKKQIVDHYKVSFGSLEQLKTKNNFSIDRISEVIEIVVIPKEKIDTILKDLISVMYEEMCKEDLSSIIIDTNIPYSEIISEYLFEKQLLIVLHRNINKHLQDIVEFNYHEEFKLDFETEKIIVFKKI